MLASRHKGDMQMKSGEGGFTKRGGVLIDGVAEEIYVRSRTSLGKKHVEWREPSASMKLASYRTVSNCCRSSSALRRPVEGEYWADTL